MQSSLNLLNKHNSLDHIVFVSTVVRNILQTTYIFIDVIRVGILTVKTLQLSLIAVLSL